MLEAPHLQAHVDVMHCAQTRRQVEHKVKLLFYQTNRYIVSYKRSSYINAIGKLLL
jgi:hypothetical protein